MATQYPSVSGEMTARPHDVAMPYRGDGVAFALRATYQPDHDVIPTDMLALLAALDDRTSAIDPG